MTNFFMRAIPLLLLGLLAATVQAAPHDVILVLDNSGSMRKVDPSLLAKRAASEFLQKLPEDFHVGVIIFDQNARLVLPLTPASVEARPKLAESLVGMNYRGRFTDSPAAIERAIFELNTKARADAAKTIVFVSDGAVDTGAVLRDIERGKWLREELATEAAASGIRIMPIAFSENADLLLIERLAEITKGESIRAVTPGDLGTAYARMLERLQSLAPSPAPTPAPVAEVPPVAPVLPPEAEVVPSIVVPPPPVVVAPEPTAAPEVAPPPLAEAPVADTGSADGAVALTADERAALEQLAKDTGVSVEQLMKELEEAPSGQAVVVRPEEVAAAVGATSTRSSNSLLLGSVGGGLLLAGLAWFFLRHKRATPTANPTALASGPPPVGNATPAEAFLIDVHGITSESARRIGDRQLIVGRTAGTDTEYLDYFVVNKATIGRRHAIIKFKDHAFWLVDQGSVNGTFVNNERVVGERMLKQGDRLKFHKFEFEFSCPAMADSNRTLVGMTGDQTIVAAQDATLRATSADLSSATMSLAATSKTAAVVATGAAATSAWLNKDAPDQAPGMLDDGDPFDVTEQGDLNALDADREAFFGDSGAPVVFVEPREITSDGDDTFDDEAQGTIALAGMRTDPLKGGAADRTTLLHTDDTALPTSKPLGLDADASAFFEDGTVGPSPDHMQGPTPDLDSDFEMLDITRLPGGVGDDDLTSNYTPPDTVMRAPRPGESTGPKSHLSTGRFGDQTTLSPNMDETRSPDMTPDDFIETGTFDAHGTVLLERSGKAVEDDHSVPDFARSGVSTAPKATNEEATVMLSNTRNEDIFDVTGSPGDIPNQETVVLDSSPLHAHKGADPTAPKPAKPR